MAFNNDNGTGVQLCDTAPLIVNPLSRKAGSRQVGARGWHQLQPGDASLLASCGPGSPVEGKAFPCAGFSPGN